MLRTLLDDLFALNSDDMHKVLNAIEYSIAKDYE